MIEATTRGPAGTARDFSQVVEAALLVEHHQPAEAIRLLRSVQGKIIDPVERFLMTEQLVLAALAAGLHSEALSNMVDWVEQAGVRDRPAIQDAVGSSLRRIPTRYLERALETRRPQPNDPDRSTNPQRYALKQWLFQVITERLAAIAVQGKDAALAAKVVEENPSLTLDPNSELLRLASGGEPPATIKGRTIGLLLSTGDKDARRRSSEVAAGISATLGFDPAQSGGVQLVFAEGSTDSSDALAELSARGTALLVAGVSGPNAEVAARYAEHTRTPVLLLGRAKTSGDYVFTVGTSLEEESEVLRRSLQSLTPDALLDVGFDTADCEGRAARNALAWRDARVGGLVLLTSERCARTLVEHTRAAGFQPWFGLGLEAVSARAQLHGRRTSFLEAGHYPSWSEGEETVRGFREQFDRDPTWFEALGRDVAKIAIDVLSTLPEVRLDDAERVTIYHRRVRSALTEFESRELWTSRAARFDPEQHLVRDLRAQVQDADEGARKDPRR